MENFQERLKGHKMPFRGYQSNNTVGEYRLNESISSDKGNSNLATWGQKRNSIMDTRRRHVERNHLQK